MSELSQSTNIPSWDIQNSAGFSVATKYTIQ